MNHSCRYCGRECQCECECEAASTNQYSRVNLIELLDLYPTSPSIVFTSADKNDFYKYRCKSKLKVYEVRIKFTKSFTTLSPTFIFTRVQLVSNECKIIGQPRNFEDGFLTSKIQGKFRPLRTLSF